MASISEHLLGSNLEYTESFKLVRMRNSDSNVGDSITMLSIISLRHMYLCLLCSGYPCCVAVHVLLSE